MCWDSGQGTGRWILKKQKHFFNAFKNGAAFNPEYGSGEISGQAESLARNSHTHTHAHTHTHTLTLCVFFNVQNGPNKKTAGTSDQFVILSPVYPDLNR